MQFKKLSTMLITMFISGFSFSQQITNSYFRHLRYNHVSPYIKLAGTYPIDAKIAKNTSHYVFTYNDKRQLIRITNNHYFTERMHPLASIGAYRTVITYQKGTETRIFFDKLGKRVSNDREVYKEVYTLDKNDNYTSLTFFDAEDNPMESNWQIAKYQWFKHNQMVIEKRFGLDNKPRNLSTYFEFGTTGMKFRKDGTPIGNYNLNEDLKITNNSLGVASYQDTYDKYGNHVKYTYHDENNKLVMNPALAVGTKKYDIVGNYIEQNHYDQNMKFLRGRKIASNQYVTLSKKATQNDSLEIKRISLGYLIALQELKPELMQEVMNDSLNKVTIGYSRELRKEVVTSISRKQMIVNAENWNKSNTRFPPNPNNKIQVLDIYNRIATVKLYSDNWVEYLHLIKLNGKWSIINLLWQYKDINRYQD